MSIRRSSDNLYWDGSNFTSATEVFNLASGTASWSYAFSLPADGSYTARSRATDNSGNVETPGAGNMFTIDTVAPTDAGSIVLGTLTPQPLAKKPTHFRSRSAASLPT